MKYQKLPPIQFDIEVCVGLVEKSKSSNNEGCDNVECRTNVVAASGK